MLKGLQSASPRAGRLMQRLGCGFDLFSVSLSIHGTEIQPLIGVTSNSEATLQVPMLAE